jgi:hypothetical protein
VLIASKLIARTDTSCPQAKYGFLASDWGCRQRIGISMLHTRNSSAQINAAKRGGRMLWIDEKEVFPRFDHASFAKGCREPDRRGICGDVCREDPEAPQALSVTIFAWSCGWQWLRCLCIDTRRI